MALFHCLHVSRSPSTCLSEALPVSMLSNNSTSLAGSVMTNRYSFADPGTIWVLLKNKFYRVQVTRNVGLMKQRHKNAGI